MRQVDVPLHELAFIAGTRGIAGVGIGLLLAEHLGAPQRRAVGWTLLGIGALTTLPIAASLLSRTRPPLLGD
jgi:hypothetical protein